MVRGLHQNGIEVIMQFYFPEYIKQGYILEIIKHWVLEYQIDGVHLKGSRLPMTLIATEPSSFRYGIFSMSPSKVPFFFTFEDGCLVKLLILIQKERMLFDQKHRIGNICCALVEGINASDYEYNFFIGDSLNTFFIENDPTLLVRTIDH